MLRDMILLTDQCFFIWDQIQTIIQAVSILNGSFYVLSFFTFLCNGLC